MNFKPVVRFAVMSDLHYSSRHPEYRPRFRENMEFLYDHCQSEEYKNLDALYIVGDFADLGKTEEYEWMAEDCKACVKDGTLLVLTIANHELHYMPDSSVSLADFKRCFNMPTERHEVINGYHFISLSGTRDKGEWHDSFDDEKKAFLKAELEIARQDTGNKPIFVLQHVGIPETLLGGWQGHDEIYSILSEYPQIIDFSGHSHNPVNDPREINQKNFTCVGTGSMAYLSTSARSYDIHIDGNVDLGRNQAHFLLVEADEKGTVRIRGIDAVEKKFFEDRYVTDCHDKSKYIYTNKRTLTAKAPYFEEGSVAKVEFADGKLTVTFPAAKSQGDRVKEYNLRFFDSKGVAMGQKNVFSDYMHYVQKETVTVEAEWTYDYVPKVEVYAVGFWENVSECIKN